MLTARYALGHENFRTLSDTVFISYFQLSLNLTRTKTSVSSVLYTHSTNHTLSGSTNRLCSAKEHMTIYSIVDQEYKIRVLNVFFIIPDVKIV